MPGLDHNQAIRFLHHCECPCHRPHRDAVEPVACWCQRGAPHPYRIAHNDAVANLGACPSPHHRHSGPNLCDVATEPRWQRAFADAARIAQDRRISRGDIRSAADVNRAIRTGRYPMR